MKFRNVILVAMVIGSSGVACDSEDSSDNHNHNMGDTGETVTTTLSAETENGHFFVQLAPPNGAVPFNELYAMGVSIYDGTDHTQLLTDVSIEIDAQMVAHGHGMSTTPVVEKQADGTFMCNGMMFHMEGHWDVIVKVTQNGVDDTATMPINCCP
ncbi:MAG: FixH family protein [Myxococcales bacterium]|nr:FixH family protein [Myxococcales bacterium]